MSSKGWLMGRPEEYMTFGHIQSSNSPCMSLSLTFSLLHWSSIRVLQMAAYIVFLIYSIHRLKFFSFKHHNNYSTSLLVIWTIGGYIKIILFYSILLRSIPFYSIIFHSIPLYSIPFHSIIFYSIIFYSILFYSIIFYSILIPSMHLFPAWKLPLSGNEEVGW